MRVFQLNGCDAYCGRTLLQAVRAAQRATGLSFRDIIDRDVFREVPADEWASKELRDGDDPSKRVTLADVMQQMHGPGMAYTSSY